MLVAGEQLANARSAGRGTHLSLPSLLFLLEEAGPDGGYSSVICKITGVELEEVDQPRKGLSEYSKWREGMHEQVGDSVCI